MPTVQLFNGDCVALLTEGLQPYGDVPTTMKMAGRLKADACVTDPPYGFDFAGEKEWDTFADSRSHTNASDDAEKFAKFTEGWAYQMRLNVLKGGSHLLAFTAGRTIGPVDRGLMRAGYDIPRVIFWLYASGQVKNPNDVRPGCEPIFVGRVPSDQNLTKLFKDKGLGQMHAQTWKAEDGKHPTDVILDDSLVQAFAEVQQLVEEHSGTFFVPKPSPKDRDYGCADLPEVAKDNRLSHMTSNYTGKVVKPVMAQNFHPTVKPIELMRRLIRLVSKPGHTIIDPFLGSGTTGVAAVLEGRNFIGIEREPDYFQIAKTRIESALAEVSHGA
jgi:DNA modification methylase